MGLFLRRHPEIRATLKPLDLRIEVKSGRLMGRYLWLCPRPPYGTGLEPGYKRTRR